MDYYKLVNIPHISRFDTWRFANQSAQDTYFDGLSGATFNDCFPPFFTNYLKIDKTDLQQNVYYNYCILNFNDERYYYFVDGIKYINEDLVGVNLIMDTIQTYMFRIKFNYSVVSRMSIKRKLAKNSPLINREYIRENLSKGEFLKTSYSEYSNNNYVLVTCRQPIGNPDDTKKALFQEEVNFTNGLYRYLILLPKFPKNKVVTTVNLIIYRDGTPITHSYQANSIGTCFNKLLQHPNVIDCIWINNSSFIDNQLEPRFSYDEQSATLTHTIYLYTGSGLNLDFDNVFTPASQESYYFAPILTITKNDFTTSIFNILVNGHSFPSATNNSTNTLFNINYIPALLDENYIQVKYGEKMRYSMFPLHKSPTVRFLKYNYYDFASFSRIYGINFNKNDNGTQPNFEDEDVYNSKIVCNTLENLDLYTDAWQTYKSQNYATLKSGLKNNLAIGIGSTLLGSIGASKGAVGNASVGTSSANPSFWGSTYGGNTAYKMQNPAITGAQVGLLTAKTLNDFLTMKENLEHTPDTRNQGNQYSSDLLSKFTTVFQEIDCVTDIEEVAKKIEYFGYKVHKVLRNENLLTNATLLPRYYYNIIQCDELTVDVDYYLQDQEILNDIEARFKDGLRLWTKANNTNMLDNLIYDNVEIDFIDN